jgi:hypothetical protein
MDMSRVLSLRLELGDHVAVGAVRVPAKACLGDNGTVGVNPAALQSISGRADSCPNSRKRSSLIRTA